MSAGTSELFCLIVCFLLCSSEAQKIITAEKITAELGQNVTLPCKVPNNININNIRAVEWSRPDQDPDHVLVYRNGRLDPYSQHPSYQNRVDLQNKDMKDRDVSLILRNVTMEDNGRYECRVFEKGKIDPISIIKLEVHLSGDKSGIIGDGGDKGGGNKDRGNKDGGNKDGGNKDGADKVGIIVGSVVGVILLLAVASLGFLIYRQHMKKNPNLPVPTDEPTAIEMTVRESPTKPATASETLREPAAEEQTTASETLMEPPAEEQTTASETLMEPPAEEQTTASETLMEPPAEEQTTASETLMGPPAEEQTTAS